MQINISNVRISRYLAIMMVMVVAMTLTACSSTTRSAKSTVSSGTSKQSSNGAEKSQVAAAQTAIAALEKTPTHIGITIPLKSTPPKGKTVVFLECTDVPQCSEFLPGINQGAKALGWTVKILPWVTTNPATLVSAMQSALQYHPIAVTLSGESENEWASEIPAYKSAGVAIIPMVVGPVTINTTVPANLMGPRNIGIAGTIIGNWFIANSGAKGHALFLNAPPFPVLSEFTDAAEQTIKSGCTACTVTTLNASLAEIGSSGVVPAIVAAVEANPSINYVLSCDGAFTTGLVSALKSIGRGNVIIGGGNPSITDEQDLLNGTEAAWAGQAYTYIGLQFIDAAARYVEHMSIPSEDGSVPQELLLKKNVGTPSNNLNAPVNALAQFKQLWKVG